MDQIKENNLVSCGWYEIIIWNSINGELLNVFKCGKNYGSFCKPVKILDSFYFSNYQIYEIKDFCNQKGVNFFEYPEKFPHGIINLMAVKNGIFISDLGESGIKFLDLQKKKVYQISPSFKSQGLSSHSLKNLGNNRFILIFSDNRNSLKVMVKINF